MTRLLYMITFISLLSSCTIQKEPYPATRELMKRILGKQEAHFIIDSIAKENQHDVFELQQVGSKIRINASSANAAAAGLNYYLKNYCHCLVTQTRQTFQLPSPLPDVIPKIRIVTPFAWRYYFNYCTFNYSMGSWNWKDWEHELDWMALNGINMTLAIVGTEAVWQNTLTQFHFTQEEAKDFIVGPAYTAWWLMGNIEGWGGPVSQSWIDSRVVLQKQILKRMSEFGMTPVFQGFYSMVPALLKSKYPNHHIYPGGEWAGFERPATLDPTDPLFDEMATVYYREMEKLYGTTLFYGGDPFHEGGNTDSIDLTKSAIAIQNAMQQAVPQSIWVLQGWWNNPTDKLLEGIDPKSVVILDLFAEGRPNWPRRDCYSKVPWVWSMLQNFGNKTGLFGRLEMVCSEPFRALKSEKGNQLVGIGSMPEGIDNNPVMFDALFDMAWRTESPNMDIWIKNYTYSRYGQDLEKTNEAWNILRKTIYRGPINQEGTTDAVVCARPSLNSNRSWAWGSTAIYYNPADLEKAWKLLFDAAPDLKGNDAFEYDLVDVTRQVLVNRSKEIHKQLTEAYINKNRTLFDEKSAEFLTLILDLDQLLGTRKEFLLGNWIEGFKQMATSDSERLLFEQNARMLITVWGDEKCALELHEYAMKQWSGLMSDFYYQRWKIYFDVLRKRLNGEKASDPDFYAWEKQWSQQVNLYSTAPERDAVDVSKKMFEKYASPAAGEPFMDASETNKKQNPDIDFIMKSLSYYTIGNYSLDPGNLVKNEVVQVTKPSENRVHIELFLKTGGKDYFSGKIAIDYGWSYYEWTLLSIENIDFKKIDNE